MPSRSGAKRTTEPTQLSHYDRAGRVAMVDVSEKTQNKRTAVAHAFVSMSSSVIKALPKNAKGDPLEIARIAGIMAGKRTAELIPLCHPLPLSHLDVSCTIRTRRVKKGIEIRAEASTTAQTGVEMEAMMAASIAALTVYDMTKALDKGIEIGEVYLLEKTGGKSGTYRRAKA
ncbi:MAG: cyclic pyranopterin monophosphate synthase MoaC [Bryobacteraceae bacterium]